MRYHDHPVCQIYGAEVQRLSEEANAALEASRGLTYRGMAYEEIINRFQNAMSAARQDRDATLAAEGLRVVTRELWEGSRPDGYQLELVPLDAPAPQRTVQSEYVCLRCNAHWAADPDEDAPEQCSECGRRDWARPYVQPRIGEGSAELLNTLQVADILGISRQRVYPLAVSRRVGRRVGRDYVFTREEVEAMRERRPGRPPRT